LGVRSTHPLSEEPAAELTFAWTSVMVTKTWEKGPEGAWQVAGSVITVVTLAMPEEVVVMVLELHAAKMSEMVSRQPAAAAHFKTVEDLFVILFCFIGFLPNLLCAHGENQGQLTFQLMCGTESSAGLTTS
jgi:hypothetical protein